VPSMPTPIVRATALCSYFPAVIKAEVPQGWTLPRFCIAYDVYTFPFVFHEYAGITKDSCYPLRWGPFALELGERYLSRADPAKRRTQFHKPLENGVVRD
jgi:hypothetical protein